MDQWVKAGMVCVPEGDLDDFIFSFSDEPGVSQR